MPRVALIYPVIRDDFIYKSIETLRKHTKDITVIVVDQSINGLTMGFVDKNVDLYLRMKNQGFAKAANEGIVHALRWQYPFIGVVNDDTEFMYDGWLPDALEEFENDPKIVAICPESPRVPLWGYGRPHEEYIDLVEYKDEYTKEDIDFLKSGDYDRIKDRYDIEPYEIEKRLADGRPDWEGKIYIPVEKREGQPNQGEPIFPLTKRGVIDAIAMWLPIFKKEAFIELGLFEERYIWGGGEDYDMNARAYSCAWPIEREECDERYHRRMVSTMKSWVWHWWGKSKDIKGELDPKLFEGKDAWNDQNFLWPPEINNGHTMDPWGHYEHNGLRKPFKRIPSVKSEGLGS